MSKVVLGGAIAIRGAKRVSKNKEGTVPENVVNNANIHENERKVL
jgi:hypothetical protein